MARINRSFGPVAGLQQAALIRPDLQADTEAEAEARGMPTDERFRAISSQGPDSARVFGRAPNPAHRPDLSPDAFHQHMLMHGDVGGVNASGIAGDPGSTFNTDPDIPGNVNRLQAQMPGTDRATLISGLRAYGRSL